MGQVEVTHLQEANGRLLEAPLTRVARHSVLQPHLSTPQARYVQAKLSVHDRSLKVATVIESLEMEMELLCLTGVEDQLQADVRPTLETLRNAGIKVGLPATQSSARAGSRGGFDRLLCRPRGFSLIPLCVPACSPSLSLTSC